MDQKTFTLLAGVIFAVVALLHLLRVYMGWSVVIGDWTVPMWVSWIAFVVAGGLSYFGLRHLTSVANSYGLPCCAALKIDRKCLCWVNRNRLKASISLPLRLQLRTYCPTAGNAVPLPLEKQVPTQMVFISLERHAGTADCSYMDRQHNIANSRRNAAALRNSLRQSRKKEYCRKWKQFGRNSRQRLTKRVAESCIS